LLQVQPSQNFILYLICCVDEGGEKHVSVDVRAEIFGITSAERSAKKRRRLT
jgi:hypothetical protein